MRAKLAVALGMFALIAALFAAAIEYLPSTLYFPIVRVRNGAELEVTFLGTGFADIAACMNKSDELAKPLKENRAGLVLTTACIQGLDAELRKWLSRKPLDVPSIRMRNGTLIIYQARDPQLSLAVCKQSEAASLTLSADKRLTCIPAGNAR